MLGEGGKLGREEVYLSRTRQEIKGSPGGPEEIYEPPKIIQTVPCVWCFFPQCVFEIRRAVARFFKLTPLFLLLSFSVTRSPSSIFLGG